LRRWLRKRAAGRELLVAMEATGPYWQPVAQILHADQACVFVLNPRCVKDYARAENQRQKTDRVDAGVIARFVRTQHATLHEWTPPAPELIRLRALLTRWDQLGQDLRREYSRRESICDPLVGASVRRAVRFLQQERAAISTALERHCAATPALSRDIDALVAEPGTGRLTAMRLVVLLRSHAFSCARQAAAYVGVTPSHRQSGTSLCARPRISRIGDAQLRHALYIPALVARRYHPVLKPWADALIARGKTPKQAACAVMRRMIHRAFGILKRIDLQHEELAA
jgi:transposase